MHPLNRFALRVCLVQSLLERELRTLHPVARLVFKHARDPINSGQFVSIR